MTNQEKIDQLINQLKTLIPEESNYFLVLLTPRPPDINEVNILSNLPPETWPELLSDLSLNAALGENKPIWREHKPPE